MVYNCYINASHGHTIVYGGRCVILLGVQNGNIQRLMYEQHAMQYCKSQTCHHGNFCRHMSIGQGIHCNMSHNYEQVDVRRHSCIITFFVTTGVRFSFQQQSMAIGDLRRLTLKVCCSRFFKNCRTFTSTYQHYGRIAIKRFCQRIAIVYHGPTRLPRLVTGVTRGFSYFRVFRFSDSFHCLVERHPFKTLC